MINNTIDYSSLKVEIKQLSIGELREMLYAGKIRIGLKSKSTRWTLERKSNFIEILMMGIPMPSVYLYYNVNTGCWTNLGVNRRLEILKEYIDEEFAITRENAIIDSSSGMTYQNLTFQDRVSFNSMKITVNFITGIENKEQLQSLCVINSYHL